MPEHSLTMETRQSKMMVFYLEKCHLVDSLSTTSKCCGISIQSIHNLNKLGSSWRRCWQNNKSAMLQTTIATWGTPPPLTMGNSFLIQYQTGNHPKLWEKQIRLLRLLATDDMESKSMEVKKSLTTTTVTSLTKKRITSTPINLSCHPFLLTQCLLASQMMTHQSPQNSKKCSYTQNDTRKQEENIS